MVSTKWHFYPSLNEILMKSYLSQIGGNNACTQTPGYYHRTNQSAMNCCQLLRALHISDDNNTFGIEMKELNPMTNGQQPQPQTHTQQRPQMNIEIQCRDISQSQMSPVIQPQNVQKVLKLPTQQQPQVTNIYQSTMQVPVANTNANANANINMNNTATAMEQCNLNAPLTSATNQTAFGMNSGMRQDTYQRTLEYVQNCRSWTENTEIVSSTSNMKINDMSTSLSSLLEENRYYNSVI